MVPCFVYNLGKTDARFRPDLIRSRGSRRSRIYPTGRDGESYSRLKFRLLNSPRTQVPRELNKIRDQVPREMNKIRDQVPKETNKIRDQMNKEAG